LSFIENQMSNVTVRLAAAGTAAMFFGNSRAAVPAAAKLEIFPCEAASG
jgi:hypothetical protein